jgi:tellurite resistance protein TerC
VIILAFVGLKMLFSHYVHIPEWVSLSIIVVSLVGGILLSVFIPQKETDKAPAESEEPEP